MIEPWRTPSDAPPVADAAPHRAERLDARVEREPAGVVLVADELPLRRAHHEVAGGASAERRSPPPAPGRARRAGPSGSTMPRESASSPVPTASTGTPAAIQPSSASRTPASAVEQARQHRIGGRPQHDRERRPARPLPHAQPLGRSRRAPPTSRAAPARARSARPRSRRSARGTAPAPCSRRQPQVAAGAAHGVRGEDDRLDAVLGRGQREERVERHPEVRLDPVDLARPGRAAAARSRRPSIPTRARARPMREASTGQK